MNEEKSVLERMSSKNIAFIGLIVIFFVLLIQSALSLFVEMAFEDLAQIDIVFRTAMTSIFGYIMSMVSSSDFTVTAKKKTQKVQKPNQIGFTQNESLETPKMIYNNTEIIDNNIILESGIVDGSEETVLPKNFRVNAQIIVLTTACVFCLIVMLIARNFSSLIAMNSSNTVTFSLFRDIISGSIGALIGLSKSNN